VFFRVNVDRNHTDSCSTTGMLSVLLLHRALSLVAQCIVIGPVCGLFLCVWTCYHDNLILCASIFTKLDL